MLFALNPSIISTLDINTLCDIQDDLCRLKVLKLDACDIPDNICGLLGASVLKNKTVKKLHLRGNQIGNKEVSS